MFTVEQYEIDMYKCGQNCECYEGITVSHYRFKCANI